MTMKIVWYISVLFFEFVWFQFVYCGYVPCSIFVMCNFFTWFVVFVYLVVVVARSCVAELYPWSLEIVHRRDFCCWLFCHILFQFLCSVLFRFGSSVLLIASIKPTTPVFCCCWWFPLLSYSCFLWLVIFVTSVHIIVLMDCVRSAARIVCKNCHGTDIIILCATCCAIALLCSWCHTDQLVFDNDTMISTMVWYKNTHRKRIFTVFFWS